MTEPTARTSEIRLEVRRGAYHDSVVLMGLQRGLLELPGVLDAGVVMATPANLDLLTASDLLTTPPPLTRPDDLLLVVRARDAASADAALAAVDGLLARARPQTSSGAYRPHSLTAAFADRPAAGWVTISVPGRYATALAHQALDADRHVFLFSDNVAVSDELALKQRAVERGLLVLGPDCGTAIIDGVGLGFANRVRQGPVGIVAASGTGAQLVAVRLEHLGCGVSQLFGTGGRDLSAEIGGLTTLAALDRLSRDDATRVQVLISKPPEPAVAARVLAAARSSGKPTVVAHLGQSTPFDRLDNLWFARSLEAAAEIAGQLAQESLAAGLPPIRKAGSPDGGGFLRGLFAGGTLAEEIALGLRNLLELHGNLPVPGVGRLDDANVSRGHTLLDLGDDAFTVGRPHPLLDHDLRLRRLRQEAADRSVRVLMLDLVLGPGSHHDPATAIAPTITKILANRPAEAPLALVVLLIGTNGDPQGVVAQRGRLQAAGAEVFETPAEALAATLRHLGRPARQQLVAPRVAPVPIGPFAAINVGLAHFASSLEAQGASVLDLEWTPPAAGNAKLAGLLGRLGAGTTTRAGK